MCSRIRLNILTVKHYFHCELSAVQVKIASTQLLSLCDISKISISSNNRIPNYTYRYIDSCLTNTSIFCPFVRPLVGQIISLKSNTKTAQIRGIFAIFCGTQSYNTQKNKKNF
jgi:hypothetical protein